MAEHLVKLDTISKIYGDYRAVDGISLDIKEGEFLTLLGPSGCGKTTTLRMIAGFETPTTGDVIINDKVVNKVPPYKREINTVFQQYALFPHMTIFNNVAFGLKMKKVSKKETEERVNKVLDLVQLNEFKNRKPDQLSGGQKQRVAIARAIVNNPEVLLLDEPLGALDLKLRKQMQLELKHLQQTLGITFIYVTHDQEEALTMSDRIVVLNEGKIEQVDTPKELYERPKTLFVANFIGETNNIKGIVEEVNGDLMTVSIGGDNVVLDNDHNFAIGDEVNACIRPEKIKFVKTDIAENSRLQVTVREYIYVGSVTKAVVILADGQEVKVQLTEINGLKEGDTAHIHWNNNDCIVYDDKEITV